MTDTGGRLQPVGGETDRRGTGPLTSRALEYLVVPRRFSEVRDELDISGVHAGELLSRLVRYGLIERVSRGVYVRVER